MHVDRLNDKQRASVTLAEQHRLSIWEGAVRSSKTICSILAWLRFIRQGPPGALLMVGKTERTLKRNILDVLVEMLGPNRCRLVAGSGELELLGRRIYLAGANDQRAAEKIRGLTLAGAYVDEVSTVPETFFAMLLSRLSIPGARLLGTTNPEGPAHWLKRDYLDRASTWLTRDGQILTITGADTLDLARLSFQLSDNPNLSPDYVQALEREYVGLWRRRYILGEWVAAEGAVYEAWNPDRHVIHHMPPISHHIAVGIDYGTVNPFHAVALGLWYDATNGHQPHLLVTSEYRYDSRRQRRQLTDAEYSQRLRDWMTKLTPPPKWVLVDPSAASFKIQLFRDGVSNVLDGDNEVLDGIRVVGSLIAQDKLLVHETCTSLIEELSGYSWDDEAAEKGEDKPLKVADHGPDALRYAVKTTELEWRSFFNLGVGQHAYASTR